MQAGIQVEPVGYRLLTRTVRTYSVIESDETRMAKIVARFPGRIDKLMVNAMGMVVKIGEPLAQIYSPKYLAAAREYVQALKSEQHGGQASADERLRAAQITTYARQRLLLAGFTDEQLNEIKADGALRDTVTLYAPLAGTVLEKNALLGETVQEETVLYTIADLSKVWIQVWTMEADVSAVRVGMPVEVTSVAYPGEIFYGTVDFISPTVNAENRSVKVRVIVDNAAGKLKPGMYMSAVMRSPVGRYGAAETMKAADKLKPTVTPSMSSMKSTASTTPAAKPAKLPTQTPEEAQAFIASIAPGAEYYICPMDPEVVSDKPGDCPKCGMALVKNQKKGLKLPTLIQTEADTFLAGLAPGAEFYQCPMDHEVLSNKAGDCPICGMHLVKQQKAGGAGQASHAGMKMAKAEDKGTVKLPTETQADADQYLSTLAPGASYYTCSMHPEVVSDKPGDCPKCGMHLVKKEKAAGNELAATANLPDQSSTEQWAEGYSCDMHPDELNSKPGVCTICGCGMKLKKVRVERVLAVPETAVIDTGARMIVYVESSPGVYDSRAIKLGPRTGEYYPVLDGLKPGDRIVSRGSFLIDAEARLNPTVLAPSAPPGHQHGGA